MIAVQRVRKQSYNGKSRKKHSRLATDYFSIEIFPDIFFQILRYRFMVLKLEEVDMVVILNIGIMLVRRSRKLTCLLNC